ncbi:hypothetical protein CIW83_02495 [Tissierella sp. P1]|nr:hypothetical protein CIW83_02495 [Tissierella sp. P1]
MGFISADSKTKLSAERLNGYEKALIDNGFKIDKEKIFLQNYTIESGYQGTMALLMQTEIDGIYCGNDLIAIGAIKALKEKNIKIPEEVKIIGFDDISISQYIDPPLTTIKQPIYQMGEEAVEMLISMIEEKSIKMTKVLETILVERGSS